MKAYLLPVSTLAVITPFLTELFSGNIPPSLFFTPSVLLITVVIYGFPALLIRELWIRRNLGVIGIFVLGLAYGVYNEGVAAKTMLMSENVPIPVFNGHSFLAVNFAWSAWILVWHSLHSILYPILIVSWLYPQVRREPWLNRPMICLLSLIAASTGIVMFFKTPRFEAPPVFLFVFIAVICLLVLASKMVPRVPRIVESTESTGLRPVLWGFSFYFVYMLGLVILSGLKLPTLVILVAAGTVLFMYYRLLSLKGWFSFIPLLLFAIGDYLAGSLILCIGSSGKGSLEGMFTGGVYSLLFLLVICGFFLRKRWV